MISADAVKVTTFVAIDPADAFQVFTEEIDAWWRRGPQYRLYSAPGSRMCLEPGVGGRFLEAYGEEAGEIFEIGRVLVWEPPDRLVFEWRAHNFRPGEKTEVEIRFEARERGTRVTLEHRGWDALPADHPVRHGLTGHPFLDMMGLWWIDVLTGLRGHARRAAPGV